MSNHLLGVDTGGTFTDFVYLRDGQLRVHKVLSTPAAPEQAILQGMAELGLNAAERADLQLVHGSTVATNAVLEGKGARTAYIANEGLKDVLSIGRQAREHLYELQPGPIEPPVPASLCLEVPCRNTADGEEMQALDQAAIDALVAQLRALQPDAVAINLLFSYRNDKAEKQLQAALGDEFFVSRSSEVLPEYREYERGMATWLNAYVGPVLSRYLKALAEQVKPAQLSIMHSAGGTMSPALAARNGVRMLLSGPAGGLQAALMMGRATGQEKLLSFDMGGTSTDVALLNGQLQLSSEGRIGRYPVAVPMVDMHTIGAGGGSIAQVDAGGLLQVGPQSAGAQPGPACYGQGGMQATVTDANLVLGRLPRDAALGGNMQLDYDAAYKALSHLGDQLDCDAETAAAGVIEIANEHMAQALRVISVQRGEDPRDYALICFGGAGGLHVCDLAERMGMSRAIAPAYGGVLSALGMLAAPRSRNVSRTLDKPVGEVTQQMVEAALAEQCSQAMAELQAEGADDITQRYSLDLRYQGQSYCLNVAGSDPQAALPLFHELHESRYGHRLDLPVELVNVRLELAARAALSESPKNKNFAASSDVWKQKGGGFFVYMRTQLAAHLVVVGPCIVMEAVATIYVGEGWQAYQDDYGSLLLEKHLI